MTSDNDIPLVCLFSLMLGGNHVLLNKLPICLRVTNKCCVGLYCLDKLALNVTVYCIH